ncbi:MAG TPA: Lrp/AsnC family transcriptional regulator [Limnochordia bacterium]|nr:Lrp/AsnC family transcriptional regulator [Limnochordia bacterium]
MRLTERRKQFLRGVVDMYRRTRLPVHYETLAERLGVSKWTAYDVLRALEEQGLLTRDYTVNRGEPGRSQIVFVPTPAAEALFTQARPVALEDHDLAELKQDALESLAQWRRLKPAQATQRIMAAIAGADVQVKFCTYIMALFLVHLGNLNESAVAVVRRLVRQTPGVEMPLTVFVGIVLGMAIEAMGHGVGEELIELLGRFLKSVMDLTEPEKAMLVSFLNDALQEDAPGN